MSRLITMAIGLVFALNSYAGHFKCIVEIEGQDSKRMDVQADTAAQAKAIIESDLQLMYGNSKTYAVKECEKLSDF